MSSLDKAENMVGSWLKPVPHLPKNGQKWLAENVWWIVLIGVIASAIGLLLAIGAIFTYFAVIGTYSYVYSVSPYGSGWMLGTIVSLLFSVATIVLGGLAISPLKAQKRKGWDMLFLLLILKAVASILGAILSFSILGFFFGIIFGAIGVAIGAYFLFEIRSHFVASKSAHAHATHTAK